MAIKILAAPEMKVDDRVIIPSLEGGEDVYELVHKDYGSYVDIITDNQRVYLLKKDFTYDSPTKMWKPVPGAKSYMRPPAPVQKKSDSPSPRKVFIVKFTPKSYSSGINKNYDIEVTAVSPAQAKLLAVKNLAGKYNKQESWIRMSFNIAEPKEKRGT